MMELLVEHRRRQAVERVERAVIYCRTRSVLNVRTMASILTEVALANDVSEADLKGASKDPLVVKSRYEVMYRCRMELHKSFPAIGRFMNRHHSTVLNGVRRHEERMRGRA